ncbi:MAG: hypothetical protein LBC53_04945 [Spirochaetaceae bacterium]|jgi:hypothetical protein|nr:hypothetical protein [Spirochaetaceae bacterium]
MNTTLSTFSENFPPYTVLGGGAGGSSGVSAVLLNRSPRIGRKSVFEDLEKCGFDGIVSLEGSEERYGLEELSASFPKVKFILPQKETSTGCKINIAANEIKSPLFFVLWDDMRLSGIKAERINGRLLKTKEELSGKSGGDYWYKRVCTVPLIQNKDLRTLPTIAFPIFSSKNFDCSQLTPESGDFPTVYPYDGVGVYDRLRFIGLGGFDLEIENPYWQMIDFGMRAWMWGEEILCDKLIRIRFAGNPLQERASADESYMRFYLKTIAPKCSGEGKAFLPIWRFFPFVLRNRVQLSLAWKLFLEARLWASGNSKRFRRDCRSVVKNWAKKIENSRNSSSAS